MANEWNTGYPIDHLLISDIPGEIRTLKSSAKTQIDREHETPADGDATGGEHSSGSGVAYEGTSTPTTRPDGATSLADNAIDRGRLWLDDNFDPPRLKRWAGSAFEVVGISPAAYAGGGSITLPNGIIFNFGSGSVGDAIDFNTNFGTAVIAICVTYSSNITDASAELASANTASTSGFTIGGEEGEDVYWIAVGY